MSLQKHKIDIKEGVSENSLFFLSFNNFSLQADDRYIFENFSATLRYNRILLIKGRVGSGKTTLLKSIAGLTDYTGVISHQDKSGVQLESMFLHSAAEFNFITGYVGDELTFAGIDKNQFPDLSGRSVYDMSGGELKKLSIMVALARKETSVILIDEPLDMLDDNQAKVVSELIIESSVKRPFIIATHDNHFDHIADAILTF